MEKLFITSVQSVLVFLRLISDRLQEQTCEKTMLRVCMQSSPASVLSSQIVNTASTHKYVLGSWLNGIRLLICLHFAATQTAKALLQDVSLLTAYIRECLWQRRRHLIHLCCIILYKATLNKQLCLRFYTKVKIWLDKFGYYNLWVHFRCPDLDGHFLI